MHKKYTVTLKDDVNYDHFYDEMVSDCNIHHHLVTSCSCVPIRIVTIADERPLSLRNTDYYLTDEEVVELKKDFRVLDVLSYETYESYEIKHRAIQTGNFNDPSYGEFTSSINLGLIDATRYSSSFYRGTAYDNGTPYYDVNVFTSSSYTYVLDGANVDIIITDSGIEKNHPEFLDSNGNSRVIDFDWYTNAGIPAPYANINNVVDYYGHGTSCAAITSGKTYGWAKRANIYSIKLDSLKGTSDPTRGVPTQDVYPLIKAFHQNKPINTRTGVKNPTIVNSSWGSVQSAGFMSGFITSKWRFYPYILTGSYTGSSWIIPNTYSPNIVYGGERCYDFQNDEPIASQRFETYLSRIGIRGIWLGGTSKDGFSLGNVYIPVIVSQTNADLEDCINTGVHVCIAAGNDNLKIDINGGLDYNNYISNSYYNEKLYYHRGGSPYSRKAFIVGALDHPREYSYPIVGVTNTRKYRVKSDYTQVGPGVDLYAAGTFIVTATSTINEFAEYNVSKYFGDDNWKCARLDGTSFASPQVCGFGAMILQKFPTFTPDKLRKYVISSSINNQMYISSNAWNSYYPYGPGEDSEYALCGGNQNVLYSRYYNVVENFAIKNFDLKIKTDSTYL